MPVQVLSGTFDLVRNIRGLIPSIAQDASDGSFLLVPQACSSAHARLFHGPAPVDQALSECGAHRLGFQRFAGPHAKHVNRGWALLARSFRLRLFLSFGVDNRFCQFRECFIGSPFLYERFRKERRSFFELKFLRPSDQGSVA